MPNRLPWDRLKPIPRVFRPASMHDVALKLAVVISTAGSGITLREQLFVG
jgi:hypothetical protein